MENRLHSLEEYYSLLEQDGLVAEAQIPLENKDRNVTFLTFNSKEVRKETLFVCKGNHFSPEYLKDAVKKGAICYISQEKYELDEFLPDGSGLSYIIVNDIRRAMAKLANYYYNEAWKSLKLIGITGTKGKSTTAYFMKFILDEYLKDQKKPKSAIVSGIDNYDGVINEESHLTTPEAIELHMHFHNAVKSDIEYLSMEVSSQALKYDRTLGVTFDVGCFLNVGEDHISDIEHNSFEDYFQSKLRLFSQCKVACVNIDTDHADRVLEAAKAAPQIITFGLNEKADVYGYDIVKSGKTISFTVRTDSFVKEFKLTMAGLFNVQNALAAIAISTSLSIPVQYIYAGLKKARVSGRMEVYTGKGSKVYVIVDYAHNKMSFETLFQSTKKEYPNRKITIVFGCPGKKAFSRRRELGEIAGKYSDQIYITEEDAGEEPVINICEEIAQHVEKHTKKYAIIPDREEAIREAITNADDNTVVLITGKGRETRQKRGTLYIDTPSDVEYVKKYLKIN
ncbi:Mur ligase family protein [Sinanaerobacter chloroacetimidivorans]|jgi:UDP-N-acetylmuramyl-tripeptide synthetase|uniref:UDP-N-acetylmuramyl-tripeptide synthetase n=1 Tax=Sinanaerobacter chloroacetimidivorans TaxID=2818044 RepID=A0A8J7W3C7_9FIRM|nr:UDP-N-acetylmuramoyl-L-alanyl-D-glutamate--2,6-diaminopimelate ligase [Sinanaerobacter chloroacetimidivorans]MBR0600134.1 UDP-N-acetylmuramoyl-L-alanyl-D-glutamate--2,6-diaminopimelate ligase [Sinanaerobacter chloroacetimidivorans]